MYNIGLDKCLELNIKQLSKVGQHFNLLINEIDEIERSLNYTRYYTHYTR